MLRKLLLGLALALLFASPGRAGLVPLEKRFAFVVTNQAHEFAPLGFTHADGEIVSAALREVGFEVLVLRDGTKAQLRANLDAFVRKLKNAGDGAVAFFYFSGHCWANATSNFIILNERPSAAVLRMPRPSSDDEFLKRMQPELGKLGVPVAEIAKAIGGANPKASFVVIDSHLDVAEPSLVVDALKTKDGKPHRGMIFAAQGAPEMRAVDSNDYSRALSGAILTPGLDASQAFKQVQLKTAEATKGKQVPWFEDRLSARFYFTPEQPAERPEKSAGAATAVPMTPELALRLEVAMWEAVNNATDPRLYAAYLQKYPGGQFAQVADLKIKELETAAVRKPTAAPQPGAAPQDLGRRVALVIGNGKYANLTELNSPVNDAKVVASAMRRLGFAEVIEETNLDRAALLKALRAFEKAAENADWAVAYFSGHGMAINGTNYIIPIDAKLENPEDARDEAVPLERLTEKASGVRVIRLIILDACRNDPFGKGKAPGEKSARPGDKGFVPAKQLSGGTLIAYAATPGFTASDGAASGYSLYTDGLLQHLESERLDIRIMFGKVYDTVLAKSQRRQEPWVEGGLPGREFHLKP